MTSLGKDASVGTITCKVLNAGSFNPPLSGVVNPLNADLSIGGNDIIGAKDIDCSQLNFTTINGNPIAGGTLANPLIAPLDGNGAGGPYSFEGIGVGQTITLTATNAISCNGIDATSGTFTTNTLTTSGDGTATGTTTATGLTTTQQSSIVKEAGSTVNGNKTINQKLTAQAITADSINASSTGTLPDLTTAFTLTCDSIADSGAIVGLPLSITGDLTLNGWASIGGNSSTFGKTTAGSLRTPITGSLGTDALPLDLTGIEGGTIDLGQFGGKAVVYAWTSNPGSNYPIIFSIKTTGRNNPLRVGNIQVQSQLYQTGAGPFPNLVRYEVDSTGTDTFKITCNYDAPSSATNTHRVSVFYSPDAP